MFIEANVKKWGLAPASGSLAPPPPYGSEQGSILLEGGREGVREGGGYMVPAFAHYTGSVGAHHSHTRSNSQQIRLSRQNHPTSPGPQRSPTDISLAAFSVVDEDEDCELDCEDAADANDDEALDISDAIYVLGSLFVGGAPPPPPFPDCGADPTPEEDDEEADEITSNSILKDSIFVKKQHLYYRIQFSDIQFIKADNVYLEVNTSDKKFLVRSPLKDYLEKLPKNKFYRAHKSYIVNVDHIDAINSKDIMINNNLIPISKDFKEFILSSMNS